MTANQREISNCSTPTPKPDSVVSFHDELFLTGQTYQKLATDLTEPQTERFVEMASMNTGKIETKKIACSGDSTVKFSDPEFALIDGKSYWIVFEIAK